ncbi:helix-turn-helix domain-containing protein [Niastella populi]|nr:helix-turn-helix domain-containing protein [Niastella populi]
MTQHEVASHFGVFYNTITLWEKNKTEPGVERYPAITVFLGYFPWEVDTSTLGGKIKEYRYLHGLTQEAFAKLVGIEEALINGYERGRKKPLPKTVERLEHFLKSVPD